MNLFENKSSEDNIAYKNQVSLRLSKKQAQHVYPNKRIHRRRQEDTKIVLLPSYSPTHIRAYISLPSFSGEIETLGPKPESWNRESDVMHPYIRPIKINDPKLPRSIGRVRDKKPHLCVSISVQCLSRLLLQSIEARRRSFKIFASATCARELVCFRDSMENMKESSGSRAEISETRLRGSHSSHQVEPVLCSARHRAGLLCAPRANEFPSWICLTRSSGEDRERRLSAVMPVCEYVGYRRGKKRHWMRFCKGFLLSFRVE